MKDKIRRTKLELYVRYADTLKDRVLFACTRNGAERAAQVLGPNVPIAVVYALYGSSYVLCGNECYLTKDAIKECFEKYGDRAADSKFLNKFVKRRTGIKAGIQLTKVERYYEGGFHGGISLESDPETILDTTSTETTTGD